MYQYYLNFPDFKSIGFDGENSYGFPLGVYLLEVNGIEGRMVKKIIYSAQ